MKAMTLKTGVVIAALYTAMIGAGMAVMHHGYGLRYGQVEMVKVLLWFEAAGAVFLLGAIARRGGLGASGFGRLVWGQLIWLLPSFAIIALMAVQFVPALSSAVLSAEQWLMVATILVVTALVGFTEELAFRGVLLRAALRAWPLRRAMLVSAIGFSLLHAVNVLGGLGPSEVAIQLLLTLVLGLFLAPVALRVGSLWPLILFHFLWNFLLIGGTYLGVNYTITIAGTQMATPGLAILFHSALAAVLWLKAPQQL